MATIYLDNTTYNEAALYAKLNNISISEAIKAGMKALKNNIKTNSQGSILSIKNPCKSLITHIFIIIKI